MELPQEGSIQRGTVTRIEPYGAFVDLSGFRCRGLVHISQIVNYKLDKVEDALSVNDSIWVKVLEIAREERNGRMQTKIRLSVKDAAQDGTGKDLGQERTASEAMKEQIAQNLNSTIGMGVALDPMAKKSNLILKSDAARAPTVINGYSLVGDDEGEPPRAPEPAPAVVVRPMGRGRGNTLPAWMTRADGPTGIPATDKKVEKKKRKEAKREKKDERKRQKTSRRSEREETRKRNRRDRDNSGDDRHRKNKRRERASDRSRGSGRESDGSISSDSSRDRRSRRRRSDERNRHRQRKRASDSDRSQSDSSDQEYRGRKQRKRSQSLGDDDVAFQSLEEAKLLIAKLEANKKHKRG